MSTWDRSLRIAAVLVSLALHALLLVTVAESRVQAKPPERLPDTSVSVTLQFASPPVPEEPAPPQPEPEPEPVVEPEPTPKIEPAPKVVSEPKPKPKPKLKPKPKPKPTPKPNKKQKKTAKKKPSKSKSAAAPKRPAKKRSSPSSKKAAKKSSKPPVSKSAYLQRVLSAVEARKRYPRAARRKGIEGRIKVSFQVLANGRIQGLKLSGGHKLLRQAARKAVDQAAPFPPPTGLKTPLRVAFAMQFQLR